MIKHSAAPTPNETLFGFIYFALQLIVIPTILVLGNYLLPAPLPEAVLNVILFAINFVAVILIFRKFLLCNLRLLIDNPWFHLRFAAIGLGIYFAGNFLFSWIVTGFYPEFANINDLSIMEMVEDHYALMTIGTVLLVPVAEESFYRGLIFRKLYDASPVAAYLVSMVCFSVVHIAGYIGMTDWVTLSLCFLQYLPAAFALAWSYQRSGSIFTSVLIHMTVNQIGMLAMR